MSDQSTSIQLFCQCGCGKQLVIKPCHVKHKMLPRYVVGHGAKGRKSLKGKSVAQRFWEKVDKTQDCWVFTGGRGLEGYGMISVEGRTVRTHRLSWEMHFGDIPDGQLVCHRCDNPSCVRPDHLFLGTDADNMADRDAKGRLNDRKGEANPRAKLTADMVREIRIRAANGERYNALGREFNVNEVSISYLVKRKTWKHVP